MTMTQAELLRLIGGICATLARNNIPPSDVYLLDAYDDFKRLKQEGHKYEYIMHYLAEQYNASRSTLIRVFARMDREVKM